VTATKYAVSMKFSPWEIQELMLHNPGWEDRMKHRLRSQLSDQVFEVIEKEIKRPTVVDLRWETWDNPVDETYRIALLAYLQPTESMRVVIAELPEMQLSYYGNTNYIPVEWQCGYCGQTSRVDQHLECRKCGAPRKPLK